MIEIIACIFYNIFYYKTWLESATGKYAAAIGEVTGLDPSIIQQVKMTDEPVDEVQLVKELKVTPHDYACLVLVRVSI